MKTRDQILAAVRLVAFDVDGVFTDGRIHLSNDGMESKVFHTHDGLGIRLLLDAGLTVAVISGRQSAAVDARMKELGIRHVMQGRSDKIAAFEALLGELGIDEKQTLYVGDDLPDLPLMRRAGFAIAVSNAHDEVKAACDLTTTRAGGSGAVREICDLVLKARQAGGGPVH